jgi:hypothetical protein
LPAASGPNVVVPTPETIGTEPTITPPSFSTALPEARAADGVICTLKSTESPASTALEELVRAIVGPSLAIVRVTEGEVLGRWVASGTNSAVKAYEPACNPGTEITATPDPSMLTAPPIAVAPLRKRTLEVAGPSAPVTVAVNVNESPKTGAAGLTVSPVEVTR